MLSFMRRVLYENYLERERKRVMRKLNEHCKKHTETRTYKNCVIAKACHNFINAMAFLSTAFFDAYIDELGTKQ